MYTEQKSLRPASTFCMTLWNVAGALHNPNGITRNSYKPLVVMNAVFSLEPSSMRICQYPVLASSVENTDFPLS